MNILLFNHGNKPLQTRTTALFFWLGVFNVGAWVWAWMVFRPQPGPVGHGFLAYLFGLRHAVDADHIAAIDNVVRKLMQDGQKPVSTGLYFSLGHSTIVILARRY